MECRGRIKTAQPKRPSASERQARALGCAFDDQEQFQFDWRLALWAIGKGISDKKLALEITGFRHDDTFLVTHRWVKLAR